MLSHDQPEEDPAFAMLAAIGAVEGDPTGADTFSRYRWQAKQAVRQWLTCLSEPLGPKFVICEHIEDVVLVYPKKLRLQQYKTRDKGSWSATYMCSHGLESLARSYSELLPSALHTSATFELWLEGPPADSSDTAEFIHDPKQANVSLRKKMVKNGVARQWCDDFLRRLTIRANQPPRTYIDAVILRELGALWPYQSMPELEYIYESLLTAATKAQDADCGEVRPITHLVRQLAESGEEDHRQVGASPQVPEAITEKVLDRPTLTGMTPPLPDESSDVLLERISGGETTSMLELKMRRKGARPQTITFTQAARADMEFERQLLLAGRPAAEDKLEHLASRVLGVAEATASKIALSATVNPVALARPAEAISAELLTQLGNLSQLDRDSLFDRDGLLVYGYLGHLSDCCRFGWCPK